MRTMIAGGSFYPGSKSACIRMFNEWENKPLPQARGAGNIMGGVVPHAGWIFSGSTAYAVFRRIKEKSHPSVFVLFGSVHVFGVQKAAIMSAGSWQTPLGEVEVDEKTASRILASAPVTDNESAHCDEHSIEVQLPMIKHLFPAARIVPIMVPPDKHAAPCGEAVAKAVGPGMEKTAFVGSSDLTHYGDRYGFSPRGSGTEGLRWVREENDRRIVDLMLEMKADKVAGEASVHSNACGAGAIAAAVSACKHAGASSGTLLNYTTSYDEMPGDASCFVGYAGVIFQK